MPDFTAVFTEERDHWRNRAEAAEAELALRDGYQVRPMTETESNLLTQVLDLRRERAEARAEVERLRGALDRVAQLWKAQTLTLIHGEYRAALDDHVEVIEAVLRGEQ